MRKNIFLSLALVVFIGVSITNATAEVNVNINVSAPSPLQLPSPPDLVVVPSGNLYVYMVPNMVGVYFFRGNWYRYDQGNWYRSPSFDGRWAPIGPKMIPPAIVRVPPEYPRFLPRDYHRISHNDLRGHWQEWDRNRHWHQHAWYKNESKPEVKRERIRLIKKERPGIQRPEVQHNNIDKNQPQKDTHKKMPQMNDHNKMSSHDKSDNSPKHVDQHEKMKELR